MKAKKIILLVVFQAILYLIFAVYSSTVPEMLGGICFLLSLFTSLIIVAAFTMLCCHKLKPKYYELALSFIVIPPLCFMYRPVGVYGIIPTMMFIYMMPVLDFIIGVSLEIFLTESLAFLLYSRIKKDLMSK